jgi:serine/threonine protein kinase
MEAVVLCQHFNRNSHSQPQQLPIELEQVAFGFASYRTATLTLTAVVVAILCAFSSCLPRPQQSQRAAVVSNCGTSPSKRAATEATEATATATCNSNSNNNKSTTPFSLTNWFHNIMGACLSATAPPSIIPQVDGGEDDYHKRFLEDQILGEGEFGVVKMVHDVTAQQNPNPNQQQTPYACKLLRKGAVFKDNTLYSPIKPQVLAAEIEILRTLQGKHYCLKMEAIYETRSCLYMVTEFCAGGEMMEYVAAQSQDLRTEDVSRIAFQLLSAVDHCAAHGILHRDIKPENVMFLNPAPQAAVRLIDFGSGTVNPRHQADGDDTILHTTFAGSAFYISPEMFQHTYTYKTDVWSAGATLYVLVAGYPAANLQKAFNILQKSQRDLRTLPNLPDNMPDSFYELLDALLTYRHKKRPAAAELLSYEFVRFHGELEAGILQQGGGLGVGMDPANINNGGKASNGGDKVDFQLSLEQISATAAGATDPGISGTTGRTASVSIRGSVGRHNIFLNFKKYERSLTTLLATMLSKTELNQLLELLKERIGQKIHQSGTGTDNSNGANVEHTVTEAAMLVSAEKGDSESKQADGATSNTKSTMDRLQEQKLHVVEMRELKTILSRDMKNDKMYVYRVE